MWGTEGYAAADTVRHTHTHTHTHILALLSRPAFTSALSKMYVGAHFSYRAQNRGHQTVACVCVCVRAFVCVCVCVSQVSAGHREW